MATVATDTLDTASLQALLGPQLTEEQARLIYAQGAEAVVFALLSLAKQLAEKPPSVSTTPDPAAPSGQTPPSVKPTTKGRAKPKGAKPGHPGHRRPAPPRIDRREAHSLSACPKCHGPVRACVPLRADADHRGHPRRYHSGGDRAHHPAVLVPAVPRHRRAGRARCLARRDPRPAGRGPVGLAPLPLGRHADPDPRRLQLPSAFPAHRRWPGADVAAPPRDPLRLVPGDPDSGAFQRGAAR